MPKFKILALSSITALVLAACGSAAASSAASTTTSGAESATPAGSSQPAGCAQVEAKYPQLKGKTLIDAMTPFTPGYEDTSPSHPGTYVGFDIDLLANLSSCLGFKVTYKSMAFAALIPALQSGQADIVISNLYATPVRAKAVNFVTYEKVSAGVVTAKGNPKNITGFNTSLCGMTAAEDTGFAAVALIEAEGPACKAAGKAAPVMQLYNNNSDVIQAVLAGRADVFITNLNVVRQTVAQHPSQLSESGIVSLPYSEGVAVAKTNTAELNAVYAAMVQIQKDGIEQKLLAKWNLPPSSMEPSKIVS